MPFQAQLSEDSEGILKWDISDVQIDSEIINVAKMKNEGKTISEISKETGLTKSQVETRNKKAKKIGLLIM